MRKRFLTAALLALVAVSSLFPLGALAESENNPKADVQSGNAACGADLPALPVIGFVNYHRQGDTVSVNFHLKSAPPNTTYDIQLWGDFCTFFGTITTVTTNRNGVANGNGSLAVPPTSTRFFATAFGPTGWSDTPAVILLP